ncbi:MAG: small multi-drug export protein [Candidatus Saliniplasma sp.]
MFEYASISEREIMKDVSYLFLTISPAIAAALMLIMLGPEAYLPVSAVLLNYYFAVGVGWLTSPFVGLATGISPWLLIILLVYVATQSSFFVTVNYDLLEKIPLLGRFAKRTRKKAEKVIKKHDFAKDITYFSIFWLMFLPLFGTGPIVMSFVGRILALRWWKVWITISLSAVMRYSFVVIVVYYGLF